MGEQEPLRGQVGANWKESPGHLPPPWPGLHPSKRADVCAVWLLWPYLLLPLGPDCHARRVGVRWGGGGCYINSQTFVSLEKVQME